MSTPPIYIDLATVASTVALSETTVQRLVAAGEFPKPRTLSGRRVAWLYREVATWAESRPVSELLPPANCGAKKARKTAEAAQADAQGG